MGKTKRKTSEQSEPCKSNPSLRDRRLLSPMQAGALAALFKVLANDTRLRILHALIKSEELCVTDLSNAISMKPQAVSNQIQRLADLGIVASRRTGNTIHYRVIDLCVRGLLDRGLCLVEEVNRLEQKSSESCC